MGKFIRRLEEEPLDGLLPAGRHPVPVRAGQRVHGVRRVPLRLADRHEHEPPVPVDGHERSAAPRQRPVTDNSHDWFNENPANYCTRITYPERLQAAGTAVNRIS
jgi:hypothetical protein